MKWALSLLLVLYPSLWMSYGNAPAAPPSATAGPVTVAAQADRGDPDITVWVNTASGVYHCRGTRWYGATKRGEYMTQAVAQKKGYRPAYGKVCR